MPIITRRLEFDAGHRVLDHEGKCNHLHGHRYVAEISVVSLGLDELGRVVDFSVIKNKVGGWIDEHWDHNFLVHKNDPLLDATLYPDTHLNPSDTPTSEPIFGGKIPYIMREGNPTVENMAQELYFISQDLLNNGGLSVQSVRLYETPNCWSDYPSP